MTGSGKQRGYCSFLLYWGALLLLGLNSGCGTIYGAAVDERPLDTIVSDTSIKTKIVAKFVEDEAIKALDFRVSSYNGHVYLIGEYEKTSQMNQAITLAKSVEGVKDMTTYLVPKKKTDTCGVTDNAAITLKVKTALVKDKEIWSTNIDVATIQCTTVVLWGLVGKKEEIARAKDHANEIDGVKEVLSFIKATQRDL